MNVDVMREILPPGVQDCRHAELPAEVAGVPPEAGEGGGGGLKQRR